MNKDEVLFLLTEAGLMDVEAIKEEPGLLLLRLFYEFDEDELEAAKRFAEFEEEEEELDEDESLDEPQQADLGYDEDEEYYGDSRLKYLSEIAIDNVGEILEQIKEEMDLEVQYVGYDLEDAIDGKSERYEFVALVMDPEKQRSIEDLLDEMDI
ncbi:hypothetical protein ABB02_01305 [Clostridiaceae bacterium JG1575]|nr:hypothetical protein ABB02_01305 [Clostridiaceae bacterium JG1575]